MPSKNVSAYVQLVPTFKRNYDGTHTVSNIAIGGVTKNKPTAARGPRGAIVVKLNIVIPEAAFLPLEPVVDVEIPENAATLAPRVTVSNVEQDDAEDE
jgi:hypothetical protein